MEEEVTDSTTNRRRVKRERPKWQTNERCDEDMKTTRRRHDEDTHKHT